MLGSRTLVLIGCLLGFSGVGIGALGAHSLPKQLREAGFQEDHVLKKLDQCEIGVRYHMYHAVAIFALGLSPWSRLCRGLRSAAWIFLLGIGLFSGGLYSMAYFDQMGHWSIVPLGGVTLMLGWSVAGISCLFPNAKQTAP